jgi:hypothetical protein
VAAYSDAHDAHADRGRVHVTDDGVGSLHQGALGIHEDGEADQVLRGAVDVVATEGAFDDRLRHVAGTVGAWRGGSGANPTHPPRAGRFLGVFRDEIDGVQVDDLLEAERMVHGRVPSARAGPASRFAAHPMK